MIFALDVGNTHTVAGVFAGSSLAAHWRISTDWHRTEDEYGLVFSAMLERQGFLAKDISGGIIASVVPPLTPIFEKTLQKYMGCSPLIVGPGIKTGMNIKYENPKEVGPDRIANAVAAFSKYGGPVIVVDFGTATTFDVISAEGDYLGGAIAPGISTSTDALFQKASRLPRIELVSPQQAVGRNTVQSMQSGIVFGFAGQTDGIVKRICKELGCDAHVVATGGLASLVAEQSASIDSVDPFLTLEGLYMVLTRNSQTPFQQKRI